MNEGLISSGDLAFTKTPQHDWEEFANKAEKIATASSQQDFKYYVQAARDEEKDVSDLDSLACGLERQAEKIIQWLREAVNEGHEISAIVLHRITESAVTALNAEADGKPETFRPIGRKAIGWPSMYSDLGYEQKRLQDRLARLEVGRAAPVYVMKQLGAKAVRYADSETPEIRITQALDGSLTFIQNAIKWLSCDSPSEKEFNRRSDLLLREWSNGGAIRSVLAQVWKREPSNTRERFELLWQWLKWETDGQPERIRELRRPEVMTRVGKGKNVKAQQAFARLCKSLGFTKSRRVILEYLEGNLSDPALENQIREGVRTSLKTAYSNWKIPQS